MDPKARGRLDVKAPLWILNKLRASGAWYAEMASKLLQLPGFHSQGNVSLMSSKPAVFLILEPLEVRREQKIVVRGNATVCARRLTEIFEQAILFIEKHPAVARHGFAGLPDHAFGLIHNNLERADKHYGEFGPLIVKATLRHFTERVADVFPDTKGQPGAATSRAA